MTDIIPADSTDLTTVTTRPLDQNPAAVYLASLAPVGRRGAKRALNLIASTLTGGAVDLFALPWERLRFQHAAAVRARLVDQYAPSTVNHALSALRGVLRAAWQLGLMTGEEYQSAAAVANVRGSTLPAGRELSPGEIAGLMHACEKDLTAAGEEVTTLDLAEYDPDSGALVINGKGSKQRTAYLTNGALYAMADWLPVRGAEPGALFYAINKGSRLINRRLTPQAIYNLLSKRAAQAGVKAFSPHDLRRTFVSDLLDAGADIATVARMAGHSRVDTTARYDRRPEEAKRKAAGLLHVPYTRRKG